MPRHIGIIMDGNGRWAKKRGFPRTAGHKKAAETFNNLVRHCSEIGLQYLTVYAFSTENWKRPPDEVEELMGILRKNLKGLIRNREENGRLLFLGDRTPLDAELRELMEQTEQETRGKTGITVSLAINYGGRDEIVRAARALAQSVKDGELLPGEITEEMLTSRLYTAGIPDPDLIIRTSGEKRSSNFLPWQSVYSEYVFSEVLWPDFTPAELDRAIAEYAGRGRRFGGV